MQWSLISGRKFWAILLNFQGIYSKQESFHMKAANTICMKVFWNHTYFKSFYTCISQYIPLISRVRGPYAKLWTEFFSFLLWPKRAGHENREEKKRGSISCRTDRANIRLIRCLLYGFVDYSSFEKVIKS